MSKFADSRPDQPINDADGPASDLDGVFNDPLFGQEPRFVARRVAPARSLRPEPGPVVLPALSMGESQSPVVAAAPTRPAPGIAAQETVEPLNLTWSAAAGRAEVSTPLENLPDGLTFRDDSPEPIRYDAGSKLLMYRGFMSAMSYRYLRSLSLDLTYLAALDELNVKSSTASLARPPSSRHPLRWAIGAVLASGAAVAAWVVVHHHH